MVNSPLVISVQKIVEMRVRLSNIVLTFNFLKIDLELLDWIILGDDLDGTFESGALVLQLVSPNGFLDQ